MIRKENIKVGKIVLYASYLDGKGKPGCEPIEVTITSEPYTMCGTECCFVDKVVGCVAIENLFEI